MNTVPLEPVPLASTKFDATGVEGIVTEGPSWVVLKTIAWATLAALFWILDGVRRKMKGERLEDHAPRIESRVDGTASEFGVCSPISLVVELTRCTQFSRPSVAKRATPFVAQRRNPSV